MENKKRGRGRPPKVLTPQVTPTITPVVNNELDDLIKWAKDNRPMFFNSGKLSNEDLNKMYRLHNLLTGDNAKIGGCGKCHYNIQQSIKRKLF